MVTLHLNRMIHCGLSAGFLLSLVAGCGMERGSADLVLRNGTIVTMDSTMPEAEALAVIDERIEAVGSNADIERFIGSSTEVIDLDGMIAIPGFIEGHGHFMGLGRSKIVLDVANVRNWDEIVEMVSNVASDAPSDAWIFGRGWHQEKWDRVPRGSVDGVPTHAGLSRVSPNNPVYLTHASGHASFANGRAMELAGIDRATPDPPGGTIVRGSRGDATGLLRENAQDIVEEAIDEWEATRPPEEVEREQERMVELAGEDLLSKGITTFHDAGSSFETIDFLKRLAEEGRLPVRLYVMVRNESNETMAEKLPEYRLIGFGDNYLTVRSIKRQIDGALGSHGAWLLEPYEDMKESAGLVLEPVDDITGTAELAIEHGFQVNTHAIGDRANREVLAIYEKVFESAASAADVRWRIEHAQHIHPDDIQRFVDLGVIASMQGIHATSDGPWVLKRLGATRAEEAAYVWRDLIDAGVVVTNGTDVPVEDADALASFYASVSRRMNDGAVFYGGQRMSREEALRSYTLNNAYAAFEENVKGSLTAGKLADIAVLSKNIMTIPEEEILETHVVYTILGGKVVYSRE